MPIRAGYCNVWEDVGQTESSVTLTRNAVGPKTRDKKAGDYIPFAWWTVESVTASGAAYLASASPSAQ